MAAKKAAKKAVKPKKDQTPEERITALETQVEDLMDLLHEHGIRHKVHTEDDSDDAGNGDDQE